MIKVGYLDDEYDYENNIIRNMKKHGIEIHVLKDIKDVSKIDDVIKSILELKLQCIFIDYDLLRLDSKVYGTYVIKELNESLSSFPCFLLTHYIDQGIEEKLVQSVFVQDKKVFEENWASKDFVKFVDKIVNSAECFEKRLNLDIEKYNQLTYKRELGELTSFDEKTYFSLYSILSAYEFVDPLPEYTLYEESNKKLDEILSTLEELNAKLR